MCNILFIWVREGHMSVCKIEGYLNTSHNPKLFAEVESGPLNDIKNIYIKILDDEFVQKIKNILLISKKTLKPDEKFYTPIFYAKEGGLLVKLSTQKLSKYMGQLMLKTPRKEWFDKKYSVEFSFKKYSYDSNKGVHFILKSIDLII